MPEPKREAIENYLQAVLGQPVTVVNMTILGDGAAQADVKGYGYGVPLKWTSGSLQRSGRLEAGFETLFLRFWNRPAFAIWVTGLPASGKSTLVAALKTESCRARR